MNKLKLGKCFETLRHEFFMFFFIENKLEKNKGH